MSEILYFEKGGAQNSERTLKIAAERFAKGDIKAVILASSYGDTALLALERCPQIAEKLIIVGEVIEGKQCPDTETCHKLTATGCSVTWGTPMGAMSVFTKERTAARIADAYRRVSEGFKVVCEICMIATTQGYVRAGAKVLVIGGTHRGADTAIVATAAAFSDFTKFEVHEILCKPYSRS